MHRDALTEAEQRVLGCLIEKRWTTPDQYPLSLNALRLACNQSTNRDPVTDYDENTVRQAAQRLSRYALARLASGHTSRSVKYRHLAEDGLGLDRPQLAVLAVLLLRGPQTPGEIKTRSERMSAASLDDVERRLAELAERGYVRRLDRRPGQKEERFAHLLGGEASGVPAVPAPEAATSPEPANALASVPVAAPPVVAPPVAAPHVAPPPAGDGLAARVAALESEVATLESEVAELRAHVAALAAGGSAPEDDAALSFSEAPAGEPPGSELLAAMRAEMGELYPGLDLLSPDMPKAGPAELGPPSGAFLIGSEGGRAVCCGGVKRLPDGACEIKRMFVVPDARGRGVARALLRALEARAVELGYTVLRLDTGPLQPAARHLYESEGYAEIENFNANPVATYFGEKRVEPSQ